MLTKNRNKSRLKGAMSDVTKKGVAKAVGMAAAMVASAVVMRAFRNKGGKSNGQSIFSLKQEGEKWILETSGKDTPAAQFDTKEEGMSAAREMARKAAPCELVIYRTDGSVQDRHNYGE